MTDGGNVYSEKLALFKEHEKPEVVLLIAEDPELVKVVVAWANTVTRQIDGAPSCAGDGEDRTWEWLWENTHYSKQELMSRIAMSEREFERKWKILAGNRVLYPDGTVNSFVQRYLREKVLNLFNAKPRAAARSKA